MKVAINAIYGHGAYQLSFKKVFDLPCAPFIGLFILDQVGENEVQVELAKSEYHSTMIVWYAKEEYFEVDVRESWRCGVDEEHITDLILQFSKCNWECDIDDVDIIKELMKRK